MPLTVARSLFPISMLIGFILLSACAVNPLTLVGGKAKASSALHTLFEQEWQREMEEDPVTASYLGDRRYNDQWPELSLEAIERRHQGNLAALQALEKIDRLALPAHEQLNYDLFEREYRMRVESHVYRLFLIPLNQRDGIQTLNQLADALRFKQRGDFEDWIARLNTLPGYVDQHITLMRQAMDEGIMPPRVVMQRVPAQIDKHVVNDPTKSLFYKPFIKLPNTLSHEVQQALREQAQKTIADAVSPAYGKFSTFFRTEYLPQCRDTVGVWDLPHGKALYEYRARRYTTTMQSPEAIHQTGLSEVARIREQMDKIIEQVGFQGDFAEFLTFLRTDPRFYFQSGEEILREYQVISKRIDPELIQLFGRLPGMPYGVKAIPEAIAPDTTTAYYHPPAADGSRAGYFYANLYRPEVRPKFEMEALTAHEAMPGHHLQIALAQELGELPNFRRYGGYTAFIEGWGLYAESLGEELGLYKDPYSKFGQLTYEMWRAVRLVVDTGIHYKAWTRQQAIDYFKANAGKTEHDIINEIDRYIAWPGQALAYKIGELKIKSLRAQAEEQLGDKFDVRGFHDTVLGAGAVPLDILEQNVQRWITEQL